MARRRKAQQSALYRKSLYRNGLTLVSEQLPNSRSVAMGVWVKTGTRYELPSEAGITHFLEHMLFKGTELRNALQITREIERLGGEFNAYTTREYTCYHLVVLNEHAEVGAEILCDILLNSVFETREIDREKKVVIQEIAMVEDDPEELAFDLYFEKVFGRAHGLGRQILGSQSSVRRFDRKKLIRFFGKHYRPENIVISAVGGVTHSKLKELFQPLAKREWPHRPKLQRKQIAARFKPAPPFRDGKWWVRRSTEQVQLIWGVPGVHYSARDRFAGVLLNIHLGEGMSSRLYQEIREKRGLAYSVYSAMFSFIDTGVFTVYLASNAHEIRNCLSLIEQTTAQLCREKISETELAELKETLKGTLLLSSDSAEARMSQIGRTELFFGKHFTIEEICETIDQVTVDQLRRLARKMFRARERAILALGAKKPKF